MTIVFEQIPGGAATTPPPGGALAATIELRCFAYAQTLAELGGAGGGTIELFVSSLGEEAQLPTYGVMAADLDLLQAYSFAPGTHPPAVAALTLAMGGFGYEGSTFARTTLPLFAYGYSADVDAPPEFLDNEFEAELTSDLAPVDTLASEMTYVLRSLMRVVDRYEVAAKLFASLVSSARVADFFAAVIDARIDDTFAATDSIESTAYLVSVLSDQLMVADAMTTHLSALVTVASALVIADAVVAGFDGTIDETFEFTEEMSARVNALVSLASDMAVEDTFEVGLSLFAVVSDSFLVDDDHSASLSLLAQILDGFSVGVRLRTLAGDEFAGYTVNVRNAAVSEYTSYDYNSLAIIGGKLYGAGDDGIYLLEGATDNGTPIDASVRVGLSNFGSSLLKRVPAAYVGYTSDGQLLLKVITTDKGVKKENHYRLAARQMSELGEGRFTPAKGLVGLYWDFELTNVDGADFELDTIKVWPLALDRRYSGR